MQKVIPRGLNYADIAPEAIDCNVKMVKMTPTATTHNAQQNDIIQFQLQGNGFLDPYSTYLKFTVDVSNSGLPTPASATDNGGIYAKVVDRSAHSFIQRWILRSNGVELERIENYDVMAAMINDVTYSREQSAIHFNEGFPTSQVPQGLGHEYVRTPAYVRYKPAAGAAAIFTAATAIAVGSDLAPGENPGIPFWTSNDIAVNTASSDGKDTALPGLTFTAGVGRTLATWNYQSLAMAYHSGNQYYSAVGEPIFYRRYVGVPAQSSLDVAPASQNQYSPEDYFSVTRFQNLALIAGNVDPVRGVSSVQTGKVYQNKIANPLNVAVGPSFGLHTSPEGVLWSGALLRNVMQCTSLTFTIPLYSGILGVLMPDKKFVPLSILPLSLELTLNPYALYCLGPDAQLTSNALNRNYLITDIAIWGHMLTFEQEIHRSLETVIAQNGLMIHYNTFYLTPTLMIGTNALPAYAQINMAFKSIKSVHFLFYYSSYLKNNRRRKLHFVSHQLTKLQLRNGIELMPSEPLEGNSGQIINMAGSRYNNSQYYIEMLKSWNKMHDVTTDSMTSAYAFSQDTLPGGNVEAFYQYLTQTFDATNPYVDTSGTAPGLLAIDEAYAANTATAANCVIPPAQTYATLMKQLVHDQMLVGRCQYGISLEGEELGQDKSIMSGRKGSLPFDINFAGTASQITTTDSTLYSTMNTFLLLDMIVYVRPDLIVTVLGK